MTYPTLRKRTGYSWYGVDYDAIPEDLVRLEELDEFEIAEDEPDPRGWEVMGSDGDVIGEIDELLVSPSTMKAYFALVNCGGWFERRRVILPLQRVTFDEDGRTAFAPYRREQFRNAPEYRDGMQPDYGDYYTYWSRYTTPPLGG